MKQLEFTHVKTASKAWIDVYLYEKILSDDSTVFDIHTVFYNGDKEVLRLIDSTCADLSEAYKTYTVIVQSLSVFEESELP